MQDKQIELVPLDEKDKNFLLNVYYKRRRFLLSAYPLLVPLVVYASFPGRRGSGFRKRGRELYTPQSWTSVDDSKYIPYWGMWAINFLFIGCVLIAPGIYVLRKRVLPLKQDADSGVKEKVPYTILRKQHFPLTDQYFVWIDDPENLDHEISEENFYSCNEGDILYIYRARKSKFVFERNGRYEII